ncbi:DMT family transporter [Faecalispora anaeroviscerum]|uniref:DMT family transporter n=1 Tax=Faecalispora anaeroviscerum TaxID=2991836 RepID=UPI0024BA8C61|nr:DMT family transporter [Faecalispora anaeroviscerum]
MKKIYASGGTLVFLGALFWSLNAPLVTFLTIDPMLICGLRSAIAAVVLSGFIRFKQLCWNGWMLMYMCSYASLCLSIILALTMTSAPVAIGMQYTATIWLFIVGVIKTRRFFIKSFIPVCIIFVGVIFFMCSSTNSTNSTGNLTALSEGVFFACMTVSAKKAAGTNPLGLTAIANIFTAVLVFVLFPNSLGGAFTMTSLDWAIMIVMGVVQVAGGYAFYNLGVQKLDPKKASIIALWEMILGPIWVALFLKKYPSSLVIIGFIIILTGMFLDAKLSSGSNQGKSAELHCTKQEEAEMW